MFADPQTLTVNSVAKNLVRINQDQYSSEYLLRSTMNEFRLKIRNSSYLDKARKVMIDRHNVEFTETVFPVAPATLSSVRKTYIVMENQQGDTLADPTYDAAALFAWLTASTNANITKLMNFES
ncbi:TPA_asm: coat protein [ssRNA phage Esthiorhiza.4_14]|uniref:Coat protein n=2 Tax=Leviviricetes TaxID=2842243 RepID=A0A8S5L2H8_9VIRU|nr:coat protein [ssRNA phage Esthiorhiza.4_14]QDH90323.1 MAG: hypothetical protein H4RhizoLitter21512_000003 [Leviviridae sp.]DAD51832.1 TPA_asm: coat protein [ssRNA phage Esthiorhiza.4_14]